MKVYLMKNKTGSSTRMKQYYYSTIPMMRATTSRSESVEDVSVMPRVTWAGTKLDTIVWGWRSNWSSVVRQELIRWERVPTIAVSLSARRLSAAPTSPTAPQCIARPIKSHNVHCEDKKLHPCPFCNNLIKLRSSMPIFCKQLPE